MDWKKALPDADLVFLLGNHEEWLKDFEREYPSSHKKEGLNIRDMLGVDKIPVQILDFGSCLVIRIILATGTYTGKSIIKRALPLEII